MYRFAISAQYNNFIDDTIYRILVQYHQDYSKLQKKHSTRGVKRGAGGGNLGSMTLTLWSSTTISSTFSTIACSTTTSSMSASSSISSTSASPTSACSPAASSTMFSTMISSTLLSATTTTFSVRLQTHSNLLQCLEFSLQA